MSCRLTVVALLCCFACSSNRNPAGDLPPTIDARQVESPTDMAVPGVDLLGRVVDRDSDPVPSCMVVLCGVVEGNQVCNQTLTADDGSFAYHALRPGYTHMNLLPYLSPGLTAKLYGGLSAPLELPPPPAVEELPDIILPVVTETRDLEVSEGGLFAFGDWTLEIAPGSFSFPGLEST